MPISAPDSTVAISLSFRVGTPQASAASSSSRMVAKPKPRLRALDQPRAGQRDDHQQQHQHEQILDVGAEHRHRVGRDDVGAARAADEGPVDDQRLQHDRQRQRGDGEEHAAQPQRQIAGAEADEARHDAGDDDDDRHRQREDRLHRPAGSPPGRRPRAPGRSCRDRRWYRRRWRRSRRSRSSRSRSSRRECSRRSPAR